MLFNLDFANNTILSCFFILLLIIELQFLSFLIPAVIAPIFNHIAVLVIPIEILSEEAKAETQKHPITAEAKIRKCLI